VGCEFYSLSKSYNTTGARISFFLGSEEIVSKFNTLRSQYDFGMFYPIQYAAIAALDVDKSIIEAQRHEYELRRNTLCDGLSSIGWRVNRSKGTMFVFAKIPDKYEDSLEFAEDLLEKTGVLCTPGSAFGTLGKKYVRFALVKPVEELQEIIRIIDESGILK
jgi:LL-diaminopimelate aminotransferase